MTDIFTSSITNESQRVFGELNVLYKANQYVLQTSSNILKDINENYLFEDFKRELYSTSTSEFFYNYGGFVLKDFLTGGHAIALYTGRYNGTATETNKERDMDNDISASYGFDMTETNGNISGNLGIGNKFSSGTSSSGKFNDMKISVKTVGGSPVYTAFISPQNLDNVNIDLSGWLSSLSDKDKHSIIDISDGGLIPITAFIREKNIKEIIENFYANGVSTIEALKEPAIEVLYVPINPPIFRVEMHLRDKYGSKTPLKHFISDYNSIDENVKEAIEELSKYMDLKVILVNAKVAAEELNSNVVFQINFADAKKVIDQKNNTIYLLCESSSSQGQSHFAFVIHYDEIIDQYAMREYINSVPEVNMTTQEILNIYGNNLIAL